jgi:hypothetical protein
MDPWWRDVVEEGVRHTRRAVHTEVGKPIEAQRWSSSWRRRSRAGCALAIAARDTVAP